MKAKNSFLITLSVIAQIVLAILFHFNKIDNIDFAILLTAGISALIILTVNCIERWFKGIVVSIIVFCCLIGCGKFATMMGYVGAYSYAQINNNISINKIVKSEDYHKVMTYNGYDYYIDNGYTYFYKIKKKPFTSEVTANTIMIASEAEDMFSNVMGEFYAINDGPIFQDVSVDKLAISFTNNVVDVSVFVKIISPENKVFYTYLTIDDPVKFITDTNIVDKHYNVGSVDLFLTKYSKIINGTENDEELNFTQGSRYVISVGTGMYLSSTTMFEFSSDLGYYDRINYYIYKDYFAEIDKYEKQMSTIDPSTEEYKEISGYVENLKAAMESYSVELCWEQIGTDQTIRLYRTYLTSEPIEEVPNITVVEIYENGQYIYATTDLTIDDLS